jgi:hypothetical protein
MPEVCADEPVVLTVSTTSPDADGAVYVLGLTTSAPASYAVATAGDTSVRIELRTVDEWPERVFAAPLSFAAEEIQLLDSTGTVIAQQPL